MSWLYSQVLVEAFLEDTSLVGEQSVQSSGSSTPQAYCAPDKMTGFSRLSRFGMTFKPLEENLGEELLMSYLAGFHAKTYQPQEKESESKENDLECGEKWHGSFTKYDPDSSMWRTHQCSLLGDLEPFSETWPQWGLMRNGECWEQTTLERTIRGTGFGLEPNGVDNFHTPNTTGLDGGSNSRRALKKRLESWPTPNAWDGKRGPRSEENLRTKKHQVNLITAVKQAEREKLLPTPNARDWKDGKTAGNRKSPGLGVVAHQLEAQSSGQLNPDWVEWLMNWPIKWSEINGFNKKEFERWAQESATHIQSFGKMRTMWWDSDPSQTPLRSQPIQQSQIKHSDSLSDLSRDITRQREMERSHQGEDLSVLRNSVHIQTSEGENLQSGMWEQTSMDEAQIVPRVGQSIVGRMERIKAIGNGQVPLCAATAWRILK